MTRGYKVRPVTPRTDDWREIERWQRDVAKLANINKDDLGVIENVLTTHIAAESGVHGVTGDVVGTSDAQTVTSKTMDADDNSFSNFRHGDEVDSPTTGVHGVGSGSVVGTTLTQTLTNKTVPDIQFSLTGAVRALAEGLLYWDADAKTLAVKLSGSAVSLQIGQELHVRAKNDQGAQINNGQAVYISGASGANPLAKLAQADTASTACVIAVATEDIAAGHQGYFTTVGIVRDINTSAFSDGDVVYLSAASAGGLSATAPALPNYTIRIGIILRSHATEGVLLASINVDPCARLMVADFGAAIAKIGDIANGNYTEIESDGTIVNVGDATTWDDSQSAVNYMRTGGTSLTLDVLDGGIYQYRFDLTDEIHSQIQLSHKYKVNTPIELHIHLVNKAAVGATAYNVGIEVEYMWASINSAFPAAAVLTTVNCSFQNAAALTHKVFDLVTLTPTAAQGSISSYLLMRVKRVAGTTEGLAGNNIFILGIDCHTIQDTLGSRQEYIK